MSFVGTVYTGSKVNVQFNCGANTALNITSSNPLGANPTVFSIPPGLVGAITPALNGATFYRGDSEYAPLAISLQWDALSITDYNRLSKLTGYYIDFISYRGLGYSGFMFLSGPGVSKKSRSDFVQVTATFYCMTPSDALSAASVNRLAVPSAPAVAQYTLVGSARIPLNQVNYYWITFSTRFGETSPSASASITASANGTSVTIGWTWPDSLLCSHASVYVGNLNDPTQSKKLAEVIFGEPNYWIDRVGYQGTTLNVQPPTANTAYTGHWQNSIWINAT